MEGIKLGVAVVIAFLIVRYVESQIWHVEQFQPRREMRNAVIAGAATVAVLKTMGCAIEQSKPPLEALVGDPTF